MLIKLVVYKAVWSETSGNERSVVNRVERSVTK